METQNTRQQILELAKGYLQTVGFNAFSFQNIADALGIKKASIHYHFRSKDEMGVALIDDYIQSFQNWAAKVADRPPGKRLEAFFGIFERFARGENKLCPGGVLSADYNTLSDRMKEKLLDLHSVQREFVKAALLEARRTQKGELDADAAADLILASVQGALQIARVRGNADHYRRVVKLLQGELYERS